MLDIRDSHRETEDCSLVYVQACRSLDDIRRGTISQGGIHRNHVLCLHVRFAIVTEYQNIIKIDHVRKSFTAVDGTSRMRLMPARFSQVRRAILLNLIGMRIQIDSDFSLRM